MHPHLTTVQIAHFWSRVLIGHPLACWLWTGRPEANGYGRVRIGNQRYLPHRLAYHLAHGSLDRHLDVCHSCDVRLCCNPAHLWLGTTQDNTADRVAKGRSAFGDRNGARKYPERLRRGHTHPSRYTDYYQHGDDHWARRHPEKVKRGDAHWIHQHPEQVVHGSRNGRAQIVETDVPMIRQRLAAGEQATAIAAAIGVSVHVIYGIKRGRTWGHVP